MILSGVREESEAGPGLLLRLLRFCLLLAGICFLVFAGVLNLTWPQQAVLGVVTVLLAMWMDRGSSSYLATLTLVFISVYATFRYGYWRVWTTIQYFRGSGHPPVHGKEWLQGGFIVALLLAEGYAAVTLLLGYLQTLWPLRRTPVALPHDPHDWPTVDLLIPTFNEPLNIVRSTALAAINIDWPADRLNVYILDDGGREEFRKFAEDAGIGYIARDSTDHAKAGNLNSALGQLSAPFVAIFDCDHVPTRSFLQITLGWFLRDEQLGMLQTPQHLYSPDPFDRNLEQFRTIPNEGELFYGIVQDGNDFWNSTLFCGSCAVLRRSSLDDIGGIAPETLTEDVHTSLRMQMSGWNTAYINIPQAAGLATESLDDHIRQRIRWARGMIQILRIENPLFAKGLTLAQRLCYFNALSHFLYAVPRLIFLASPLAYLIFGRVILPGSWAAILAFALPHLLLSSIANSRIQGQHRHPFWNEIYETILAPYILFPTLVTLLRPGTGRFEVTPKGGVVSQSYFDGRTAIPFLGMMALQVAGLLFGVLRIVHVAWQPLTWLRPSESAGTVVMNMLWAVFNLVILGVCTSVAWESHQRRATVRLTMAVPVDVLFSDGTLEEGLTADISSSGVALRIDESLNVQQGEQVQLIFPVLDGEATLPATVVDLAGGVMRAQFDALTLQEEETLTLVLYSRADTWLGWGDEREVDRPWKSLQRIVALALRGFWQTLTAAWETVLPSGNPRYAVSLAQVLVVVGVFMGLTATAAQFRSSRLHAARIAPVYQAVVAQVIGVTEGAKPVPSEVKPVVENTAATPQVAAVVSQSPDELKRLPLPFYDGGQPKGASIPIVFLSEPSHDALQAAGIVASWFGIESKGEPIRFPIVFGAIPHGNAIVILENSGDFSPALNLPEGSGATVSMRSNPEDVASKLLVISGNNGAETIRAATGLALQPEMLFGDHVRFTDVVPVNRQPDKNAKQAPGWATLPDLHLFARDGFPFTRKKDLSDTVVVLPEDLTPESVELYLTLMGQFGARTGYPALNVTVASADGVKSDRAKDYLVLDAGRDQSVMRLFNPSLPVIVDSDGFQLGEPQGFFSRIRHDWWRLGVWRQDDSRRFAEPGGTPDGVIEGAAWPSGSDRTVVVIALRDPGLTEGFVTAYLAASRSEGGAAGIGQSVSVFRRGTFTPYRIGGDMYHAGSLSPQLRVKLALADFPWLLVLADFAVAFGMAILVRSMLRQRARQRLLVSM